jgi:hypothetical protein
MQDQTTRLTQLADRHGLDLAFVNDERGTGWALYDRARDVETGPPWKRPGNRMTLAEVERALGELPPPRIVGYRARKES